MQMMFIYWEETCKLQRKTQKALSLANKEIGLEVNCDKSKYMPMSRDQNAGRSHIKRLVIFPLKMWESSDILE